MGFPTDGPPILTPQQFDQLVTRYADAHAKALKTGDRDDWRAAEVLQVQITDAYARISNILNQAITEDLKR
jgi:hypothetical protein